MRRPAHIVLGSFVTLVACSGESPRTSAEEVPFNSTPVETLSGIVVSQADGDTLSISREGVTKPTKIRFVGIDTPEKERGEFPGVSQEPWASAASHALGELLPLGTSLRVTSFGADAVGRVLGRVARADAADPDAASANETMVRSGTALPLVFCGSGSTCSEDDLATGYPSRLRLACEEAESAKRGVFADPPLDEAPYEFRTRAWASEETDWVGDATTRQYVAFAARATVPRCRQVLFLPGESPEPFGFRAAAR